MKVPVHRNYHRLITLLVYPSLCPDGIEAREDGTLVLTYYPICRRHKGRVGRVLEDLAYLEKLGFIYDRCFISKGRCSLRLRNNKALTQYYGGR
jgi:hypothetical protein